MTDQMWDDENETTRKNPYILKLYSPIKRSINYSGRKRRTSRLIGKATVKFQYVLVLNSRKNFNWETKMEDPRGDPRRESHVIFPQNKATQPNKNRIPGSRSGWAKKNGSP